MCLSYYLPQYNFGIALAHERDNSHFLFSLRKMTKSGLQYRNFCVVLESVPGVRRPSRVIACHFVQATVEI